MLRTDHCYPPTVRAPLDDSPVFDFHFEAIAMPAPLPPTIEPLPPSPQRTNNPPVPEVMPAHKVVYIPRGVDQQGRQATGVHVRIEPPSRVPWLACAIGAALFVVGYLIGKYLP